MCFIAASQTESLHHHGQFYGTVFHCAIDFLSLLPFRKTC